MISDCLHKLPLELVGQKYTKPEHRLRLSQFLENRSDAVIEKIHQNNSAVLIEFGYPASVTGRGGEAA